MSMKHLVRNKISAIAMSTLLVLELIPAFSLPTVSAATVTPVFAAAYMGSNSATGTTLPATVQIDGQSTPVTWSISDDAFAVPYDTVTVTGTAGGQSVSASVEVIPPASNPLVYFVDSGRGGDSYGNPATTSPVFEAVKQLTGSNLLNLAPDQRYVSGTTDWGFDDSVQKVKNAQNGNLTNPATDPSIWVVGLRADPATQHIIYKLKALEAGTYTLSSGFYDWYGTRSRDMRPQLEYTDQSGAKKTLLFDQFNTNTTKFISSEFTIPADIDTSVAMTLTYAYVANEKPILSWFAIAQGGIKQMIADAKQAAASLVKVTLDGNDVKADNLNGLTFKGFGVLSGNSSSALLMDYKSENPEAYAEMIRILFGGDHPLMDHVKIEMGNDRNNSTGPDPATMRTADESANVARHPGFQLAADAKKVNPNLKVSILRWNAPGWANSNDKIYTWYKNTILAAYRQYGYMVDYVNPGVNESSPDLTWTKQYASQVKSDSTGFNNDTEKSLYNSIKVVISDEVGVGSFGGTMVSDVTLRDAVAVAGYHYNTDDDSAGNFKKLAEQFDKEVWNSEAQATFSNSAFRPNNNMKDPSVAGTGIGGTGGPLEMGNTIIKGFVNSRRTHFVYQPAIGSFYEGGQYSFKELLSARDPWSGWMHYDAGLIILKHFSDFANTGWENDTNTAGIWRAVPQASYTGASGTNPVSGRNGTPSYMTLAAPDKSNFSTVIVNDSEYEKTYKLQALNMSYTGNPAMEVWETRAANQGAAFNSNYLKYLGNVSADNGGVYTVHVKPYSIVTVTTLQKHGDASFAKSLPVEGERTVLDTDATGAVQNTTDKILYADNFDYTGKTVPVLGADGHIAGSEDYIDSRGGSKSVIPRYTSDRNGAFEAYLPDGSTNYVLRQQVDKVSMGLGGSWNSGDPVTGIGDNRWMNYKASIDVSFENNSTQSGANYAAIGARSQGGGSSHAITGTPYVLKFWFDGGWQLLVNNSAVASGNAATGTGGVKIEGFNTAYDAVHNMAVQVAGATISAYLDNVKLAEYTDAAPKLSGRVDLASGYYNVRFDNLRVETVDGYAPYYTELLDNLEMNDLASPPATKLVYSGSWSHQNGQGMYVYQRSISTSQSAGAALSYTFTGTGLDILGLNDGSAKLNVTIDGQVVAVSAATVASKELYQTYALRGLSYGQHTVQVTVVSGTLAVDAVAVVSGGVQAAPDVTTLQNAVNAAQAVSRQDEYTENNWTLFETALSAAQAALTNPVSSRLDQEGVSQLAARLTAAQNRLLTGNIQSLATPLYAANYVGHQPNLPQKVEATLLDGSKQLVTVNWNLTGLNFDTPYATVAVTGTYGNLTTVCYVEVVPENMLYFADLNATAASALGYNSPAYTAVAALATASGKALLNPTPDQAYNASTGWGYAGFNASGAASVSFKGIVSGPYSKQTTTGIYTANANGAYLTYAFDNLPAGKYALTFGTHDWWSVTRTADVYLEYDGKSVLMDTFTLTGTTIDAVKSYTVTKEQAGTLKLKLVAKTNNQSPLLSFVGLSEVIDKTALQALYADNKEKANDNYTEQSWHDFQTALANALSTLNNGAAAQADVDQALQALNAAIAGLVQIPDTVKPVITLLGSPIVNLHPGDSYTDAGVTATDDRDGDITANTVTTITYNGNLVPVISTVTSATYVVHYNVSDLAGNAALEVTRMVNIAEDLDTAIPVLTLTGQSVVNLTVGDGYTDAGATAADDRDGDITGRIMTTVTKDGNLVEGVNTAVAGTYVYHYNVSDLAGNAAVEITRTVIVTPHDPTPDPADPTPDPAPAPTVPAVPETPAHTLVVGNADVSNATNGAVAVKVSEGIETVVLPANTAEKMGDNALRLDMPKLSIEFSKAALDSIQGSAGGRSEGAQIQITAVAAPKDTVGKLSGPSGVQLGAASEIYNFSLSVVSADGTKIPVTAFKEPLVLKLKVDPNANPDLLGIYYIAEDGKLEFIGGKLVDGMMVAQVSHFSKYAVLEYNKSFADVSTSFWANGVIKKMAAKHIIDGVDDTHFNPQGNVTRAQFAALLVRALGLTDGHAASFKDVASNAWYADVVAKASAAGLVTGRTSDTFAPDADVTREEMAVMIVRAYEYLHGKTTTPPLGQSAFGDQGQVGDWAQSAVGAAQAWGLISGRSGNVFAPQAQMNRAESAQVIANLLQ
ncbi:S-layer homology domain-containing protein [Paenibacillus whitsoniae]|uniref:DUF5011 domain-containing protein n=1 Tax=Paenibacillus whitsoniae TaxID=2496558 RepID=A0A430J4V6_9BACL|nr:S-layer homology domain-containing protein [Paenibacillus whitsoniae]RTE02007.1 DUF5011 domain-containing protein [Paenibacillus whitsoniae]